MNVINIHARFLHCCIFLKLRKEIILRLYIRNISYKKRKKNRWIHTDIKLQFTMRHLYHYCDLRSIIMKNICNTHTLNVRIAVKFLTNYNIIYTRWCGASFSIFLNDNCPTLLPTLYVNNSLFN
jgi:hypothetical protein